MPKAKSSVKMIGITQIEINMKQIDIRESL